MVETAQAILGDEDTKVDKLLDGQSPHEIAWREWGDAVLERGDLEDALDDARTIITRLSGGGSMSVEPTRALVAVDVNTGSDTSQAAGLKANIAAAKALPRLLRCKGLGGQIVIDFAPLPKKDRKALENALRSALRQDDVETALVGWTPMGLFELNRKRARTALHDILA